jgi:DHA1 family multidrug resistance protein-like MFS transporter/DHA1 family quinolone resistance protein-like MFS transporter
VFSIPYIIFPTIIGFLSDKFERRIFFLIGISGCASVAALFIFTNSIAQIIAVRFFNGIVYAFMWPSAEALITDVTSKKEVTRAAGLYSFSWALGFLIGPFIGGSVLTVWVNNFQILFLVALIIGILACAVAFYSLGSPKKLESSCQIKDSLGRSSKFTGNISSLVAVYLVIIVYSIGVSLVFSIFPGYANNLGVDVFEIGILFVALGVTRTITFLHSQFIARISAKKLITIGLIVEASALLALGYFRGFINFLLLFVILGLGFGILAPISFSTVSKMAPRGRIGITMGIFETFFGVGFTIGPFLGGVIAESISPNSPYFIFGVISLLSVISVIIMLKGEI